jgi:uncharacterized membrane protein (DUF485 family)
MTYEEMMCRQLRLSITLACIFLLSMFIIPFLNHAVPDLMLTPVMNIPFVWLAVGFLLHLEFWFIAIVYTVFSNRWEREVIDHE